MADKFRVGQTVQIINETHGWGDVEKDDIGTISAILPSGIIVVITRSHGNWKGEAHCFKLIVDPYAFNLSRALAGDDVITVDGYRIHSLGRNKDLESDYKLSGSINGEEKTWTLEGRYRLAAPHSNDLRMVKPAKVPDKKPAAKKKVIESDIYKIGQEVQVITSGKRGMIKRWLETHSMYEISLEGNACHYAPSKLIPVATSTKPKPDVQLEAPKKMATTPKSTTKAALLIEKNKQAAITAAKIEAGTIAVNRITALIKPKLPMMLRGYAETPAARIVIANLFSLAVQQYAADNEKAVIISDAMMQGAMLEFVKSFNIEAALEQVVKGVDFTKLTTATEE